MDKKNAAKSGTAEDMMEVDQLLDDLILEKDEDEEEKKGREGQSEGSICTAYSTR